MTTYQDIYTEFDTGNKRAAAVAILALSKVELATISMLDSDALEVDYATAYDEGFFTFILDTLKASEKMVHIDEKISTFDQACSYIERLMKAHLDYHFEDSATDCLRNTGLSQHEMETVQNNIDDVYHDAIQWGEHVCPIGYMLSKQEA